MRLPRFLDTYDVSPVYALQIVAIESKKVIFDAVFALRKINANVFKGRHKRLVGQHAHSAEKMPRDLSFFLDCHFGRKIATGAKIFKR